MKIVHIITRLIVGGAQENTLLSCEGQHGLGHHVTLITGPSLGPEGSLMERAEGHGYNVETLSAMRRSVLPMQDWRTYRWLTKRLREIAPDVVHTHSSKAGIIGRWAAHAARVPVIVHTIHGLAFTASTRKIVNDTYRLAERWTAPITTRIVCVADAMPINRSRVAWGKVSNTSPSTAAWIPAVYSSAGIAGRCPPWGRLGDEHIAVGTIARLFDLKGHEDLLDLAPRLCDKHPNLRFLWVGDGSRRENSRRASPACV